MELTVHSEGTPHNEIWDQSGTKDPDIAVYTATREISEHYHALETVEEMGHYPKCNPFTMKKLELGNDELPTEIGDNSVPYRVFMLIDKIADHATHTRQRQRPRRPGRSNLRTLGNRVRRRPETLAGHRLLRREARRRNRSGSPAAPLKGANPATRLTPEKTGWTPAPPAPDTCCPTRRPRTAAPPAGPAAERKSARFSSPRKASPAAAPSC